MKSVDGAMQERFPSGKSAGRERSLDGRSAAIIHWLPLVRVIASREFQRLGTLTRLLQIDFDDLFQTGVLGLILALDHYDPRLSAPKTYFTRRIRGAMLDFLRTFPYFKNGETFQRVTEAELPFLPVTCLELREAEMRADCEKLLGSLKLRQRAVIWGILREIPQFLVAQRLGVNESRISQIKTESLATLRSLCASGFRTQTPA